MAERIGLITEAGDLEELMPRALHVAQRLAESSPSAIRMTKHAMNNWMRMAWPIFDSSLAMEILGFAGPDMAEGLAAFVEKRDPKFERYSPA